MLINIALVGNENVGKTEYINRISDSTVFIKQTTIGVITFDITIISQIQEIQGDYDLIFYMFDTTNKFSFESLISWYNSINIDVILANNADHENKKIGFADIPRDKGAVFLINTKSNYNIEIPFLYAIKKLTNNYDIQFL